MEKLLRRIKLIYKNWFACVVTWIFPGGGGPSMFLFAKGVRYFKPNFGNLQLTIQYEFDKPDP